ncbi:hypothetical protein DEU56DRAFT_833974 [Suillus clintonianus]|uniref:uncharacterized protein n=1 Tax=Suillus clintonianus TaxID=1904413 RepID=UPI001B864041|nr:uncharacterized protein DEU56DRAFT_833974 [Suillus clintonianus]KAG2121592.1 hypothetical protein DEU56DRAFT_833974 [Suillus clintonianus]
MKGHSPEMVWFHKFEGTSTTKIRRAPRLNDAERDSCNLLYIITLRKLLPITTLTGNEFLAAWWQIVICHRALWKRGVRHHDTNPSNFMGYHSGGRFIGVFNDFDLSSIKRDGPGFERTVMLPFMALELLADAITGEVEHVYQHVAESFIWVLTWICLRYEGGKLLSKRPLDDWLIADANACHDTKMSFIARLRRMRPPRSHKENFNVAMHGLAVVYKYIFPFETVPTDDEVVFQTWLQEHMPADVREGNILSAQ